MTDLEITRLCAEAMDYDIKHAKFQPHSQTWVSPKHDAQSLPSSFLYNPLHDNAQAMALVKRFALNIVGQQSRRPLEMWEVYDLRRSVYSTDLNRAICECVAQMQQERR